MKNILLLKEIALFKNVNGIKEKEFFFPNVEEFPNLGNYFRLGRLKLPIVKLDPKWILQYRRKIHTHVQKYYNRPYRVNWSKTGL